MIEPAGAVGSRGTLLLKRLAGLALAGLLLARPQAAAQGAQAAMAQWYASVAPALFPFMALMPMLTGDDAAGIYERLLGGVTRALFGLPGAAAPALVIGAIAGSPAGVAAARRVAARSGMNRGQLLRLAASVCGLSPAFLIGGVGVGMLDSPAAGHLLLRSQLGGQVLMAALLRGAWRDAREPAPPFAGPADEQPVRVAVSTVLTVCGYMALFGALARAAATLTGPAVGGALLCALDAPSGARLVSQLPLDTTVRLVALSALCGFGGVCVGVQNRAVLKGCGMRSASFWALRLIAAALNAALTAAQLRLLPPKASVPALDPLRTAALAAAILAIPVVVRMRKTIS